MEILNGMLVTTIGNIDSYKLSVSLVYVSKSYNICLIYYTAYTSAVYLCTYTFTSSTLRGKRYQRYPFFTFLLSGFSVSHSILFRRRSGLFHYRHLSWAISIAVLKGPTCRFCFVSPFLLVSFFNTRNITFRV